MLTLERLLEAPAVGPGLDDVGIEGEPVDHRLAQALLGKHLGPFTEREVGRDDQRSAFVAFGEDLEDQFGGAVWEGEVAELVDLCGYPHRSTYAYAETATMPT